MRLTELLSSTVIDGVGGSLGPVRDVQLVEGEPGEGARFRVAGIVVGGGLLARQAHAWGFTEGRASGPWPLSAVMRDAVRQARFIPAERVVDWGPGEVRVTGELADFPALREVVAR